MTSFVLSFIIFFVNHVLLSIPMIVFTDRGQQQDP